jgi:hypothetical protein
MGCEFNAHKKILLEDVQTRSGIRSQYYLPTKAATHNGTIIRIKPGTTLNPKPRPPAVKERTAFVTVFVVKAAKIGTVASFTVIFPAVTKEATETAAECASPKPAIAAAAMRPLSPKTAFTAAEAKNTAVTVTDRISVTLRLKADPAGALSGEPRFSVRNVKIAP